jgi:nucleoside-diphosphate-sugar epimerase
MLDPTNPYAATKAGAEHLVKAYHKSFSLPTIITRGNNVYGPHQYPEKIIPKFINQLLRDKPLYVLGTRAPVPPSPAVLRALPGLRWVRGGRRPAGFSVCALPSRCCGCGTSCVRGVCVFGSTLHGTGSNTRNYLYVVDVARAFDVILHKGVVGLIYNIGSSNEFSNFTVAKHLLVEMGKAGAGVCVCVPRPPAPNAVCLCVCVREGGGMELLPQPSLQGCPRKRVIMPV